DAQELRKWQKLLALKARVEIAEDRFIDAARTIATGFAFGQHAAEGPFVVNGLVGAAGARLMIERLEEWVARPGSPNLYWALTALPRPLIDMRDGLDTESVMLEWAVPEIQEALRPHSPDEWQSIFVSLARRLNRLEGKMAEGEQRAQREPYDLEHASAPEIATARTYLHERGGLSKEQVAAMPTAQVLVLAFAAQFMDFRDNTFKVSYLPHAEKKGFPEASAGPQDTVNARELLHLAAPSLLPLSFKGLAFKGVAFVGARLDRKIAVLRV